MSQLVTKSICFVACHGGPADHFATFADHLANDGAQVKVYASGPALDKLQNRGLEVIPFAIEGLTEGEQKACAIQMAQECSKAAVVITDVGHSFDVVLQKTLAEKAPEVLRIAYYDNPEPYVPGGYSQVAAQVMLAAQKVLFANSHLKKGDIYEQRESKVELPLARRVGLGYYPVAGAEKVAIRREKEHRSMRAKVLTSLKLEDKNQKILVYFGGNNEEYFKEAFPAFLNLLISGIKQTDLSNTIVVLQQHPGAKSKNLDVQALDEWIKQYGGMGGCPKMVISDKNSEDMQVVADGALYYQTSMGPSFALAGIPMVQVGHKIYEDILVKGNLCASATNVTDFIKALQDLNPTPVSEAKRKIILDNLGIREDWFEILKLSIEK